MGRIGSLAAYRQSKGTCRGDKVGRQTFAGVVTGILKRKVASSQIGILEEQVHDPPWPPEFIIPFLHPHR